HSARISFCVSLLSAADSSVRNGIQPRPNASSERGRFQRLSSLSSAGGRPSQILEIPRPLSSLSFDSLSGDAYTSPDRGRPWWRPVSIFTREEYAHVLAFSQSETPSNAAASRPSFPGGPGGASPPLRRRDPAHRPEQRRRCPVAALVRSARAAARSSWKPKWRCG